MNDNNEFTYTPADALSHGEHTIAVEVTDGNGRTAQTSSVFTVDIPGPTVAIHSPASGQLFDHGKPVLRGEFTGVDPVVELTVTVNGEEIEVEVDGNEFTYTPADGIGDGDYTVVANVVDPNGKTAKATIVFTVSYLNPL